MSIWIEKKFKESEIGKIPLDWSCTTLNKIADINPKPIKLDSDDIAVSFVGMADVSESAKLMNTTNRNYSEVKKGFTSFQDDDVLVAKITPCFENGKGALAFNLTNGIGFGSTEFHVIRAKEKKGNPEFIHHITTTHNFRVKGEMNMTGTAGQKRVGKDFIASYLIACPPLAEQQKIAEVLSTVDKKIDLIDQKIAETEKLKTGLMQKLFSEGVGVQDSDGNWQPHSEFQESTYGSIPLQWEILTFKKLLKSKDLIGIQDGNHGESHPVSSDFVSEGIPFITANKISNRNKLLTQSAKKISYEQYNSLRIGFSKPGDVILTHKGTVGLTAIVSDADGSLMLSPQTTYYRLSENAILINSFLYYFFQSAGFQKVLNKESQQSTRAYIGIKKQAELNVLIPNLKEQEQISAILNTVDLKIDLLTEQKAETQQLKQGLMQKLLTGEWRVPLDNPEAA
ncbi:restriction endonuclease subunit S [Aliivibrio fischeri]|uniref:restriction endonuclease subunit S n=1 Tax=Aliivibrio fischeri TaxID=668 RepID=UPI0007C57FC8|nr:restriction endonuclease subunit S [Aliivibrio fischeri]